MSKLRYRVALTTGIGFTDVAYVRDADDPAEALSESILQNLSTDVDVTIAGVTMFLAAWMDPGHWSTDWAEKLGIPVEKVHDAVVDLFAKAVE